MRLQSTTGADSRKSTELSNQGRRTSRFRCLSTLWLCVTCTVACVDSSVRVTSLARSPHFVTNLTQEATQGPLSLFARQAKNNPENRVMLRRIQGPLAQGEPAVIMGSDASAWVYPLARTQPAWRVVRLNAAAVAHDAWKAGLAAKHFPRLVRVVIKRHQRACDVRPDCERVVFVVGDDIKQLAYAAPRHSLAPYQSPSIVENEAGAIQELLTSGPVMFTLSLDTYHGLFGSGVKKTDNLSGVTAVARATNTAMWRAEAATFAAPTTLWPPPRTAEQFARDTAAIESGWKKHGLVLPEDLTETAARLGYTCMRGPTSSDGPITSFIKGMEEFSRAQKAQGGTVFNGKRFAVQLVADSLGEDPQVLANQPVLLPKSREQALQDAADSPIGACFGQKQRQELLQALRSAAARIVDLALTFQVDLLAANASLDDASRRYAEGELQQRLDDINDFLPGFSQSIGPRDVKLAGEALLAVSHALRAGRVFRHDHPTIAAALDQRLEKMAGLARKASERSGSPLLQAAVRLADNKDWRDTAATIENPFGISSSGTPRSLQESLLFQLRALWNQQVSKNAKPDVQRAMATLGDVVLGIAQDGPGEADSKRRELVVIAAQTLHATLKNLPDWKSTPGEFLTFAQMMGYYATQGKGATNVSILAVPDNSDNNARKGKTTTDDSATNGKVHPVTTQTAVNRLNGLWGLTYKIFDVQEEAGVLPEFIAYHSGVQQAVAGGFDPTAHDAAGLSDMETALFGTPAKPKKPKKDAITAWGRAINGWPANKLPSAVMGSAARLAQAAFHSEKGKNLGKNRETFLSLFPAVGTVANKFDDDSSLYRSLTATAAALMKPSSPLHTSDKGGKHKFQEMIRKYSILTDRISNSPDELERDLGRLFERVVAHPKTLTSSSQNDMQYAEVMARVWQVLNALIDHMETQNSVHRSVYETFVSFYVSVMDKKLLSGKTVKTLTDDDKDNAKKEIEKIKKITKRLNIEIQSPAFNHPDVIVALQMITEFSAAAAELVNKIPNVQPELAAAIAKEFRAIRGALQQDGKPGYSAMLTSVAKLRNDLEGLAF
ncbi:MAG: hypothetical protein AAF471_01425 [Myxococcota bacterium]